ncbi:MAG: hypothetical protein R2695_05380 [Acidimicrobiales bacterium]
MGGAGVRGGEVALVMIADGDRAMVAAGVFSFGVTAMLGVARSCTAATGRSSGSS